MSRKKKRAQKTSDDLRREAAQELAEDLQENVSRKALGSLVTQLGLDARSFWDSKKKAAEAIARHWFDPETPRRVVTKLSRTEALAFAQGLRWCPEVSHHTWVSHLVRVYGGREKDWSAALERLLLAGLIFPMEEPSYGRFQRGTWYFLPQEICALIGPILPQCPAVQTLPLSEADARIAHAPGLRVSQCAALLCAIQHSGVKVNQNHTLNKSDLKRLLKVLPESLPFPLEPVVHMLIAAGCLKPDAAQRLNLMAAPTAALLRSEQALRLLRFLMLMASQHPLGRLIVAAAYAAPPGGWAPLDAIEVARAWVEYGEGMAMESGVPLADYFYEPELQEPLHNIVQLAAVHSFFDVLKDHKRQIVALRPSQEFLSLADPSADPVAGPGEPAPPSGKLHVQPNFDVIAPPDVSGSVLATLIPFVELKQMDVAVTYHLTAAACRRFGQDGGSVEAMLSFLQENSTYGMPENVIQTVRGWMRHAGTVRFVQGLVLQCLDPQAAAELKSHPTLRPWILRELAPQLFLVDGKAYSKIRATLDQLGYILPRGLDIYPSAKEATDSREKSFYPRSAGAQRSDGLGFSVQEAAKLVRELLVETRAFWSGTSNPAVPDKSGAQRPPKSLSSALRGNREYLDEDLDEDFDEDFNEQDWEAPRIARRSASPSRVSTPVSDPEDAGPTPSLGELTPLTGAALEDSLQKAITFGLKAFIGYPKEGRTDERRVWAITPHWIESRAGHGRALWAYCQETDREDCFLLSKISGVLLVESKG